MNGSDEAGLNETLVEFASFAAHGGCQDLGVREGVEVFTDIKEVSLTGHPVIPIKAGKIYRAGEFAKGELTFEIVVVRVIGHAKLSDCAVYRFAEPQSGVIGLADGTPPPVFPESREQVVIVTNCHEINNQRWVAEHSQRRSREVRSFGTMGETVSEHAPRGTARLSVAFLVVFNLLVEKALYPLRTLEASKNGYLHSSQTELAHA
jgi:hypothetical protein